MCRNMYLAIIELNYFPFYLKTVPEIPSAVNYAKVFDPNHGKYIIQIQKNDPYLNFVSSTDMNTRFLKTGVRYVNWALEIQWVH